eukprot:COSAG02_NODE_33_length_50286_cov_83.550760_32_plen_93_part_00
MKVGLQPLWLFVQPALVLVLAATASAGPSCPDGTTRLDAFSAEGKVWVACEDLSQPGGGIALVPDSGDMLWVPKSFLGIQWDTRWRIRNIQL